MMSDVRSLNAERAIRQDDNSLWTPEDCLRDVIADLRDGKIEPTAVLVLLLDADDGKYDFSFRAANLTGTQQIALMSRATHTMHRRMDGDIE